jgi:3-oxoacyl-[acyl-carrier protein] reductase
VGLLDGKVAIVTGAGQGLGRVEALELARHGASVVVNDLGTAADGTGADEAPARGVVAEIGALGGKAVAAFGDVADFDAARGIVQAAVEAFGDVHILVNNAGFSRDGMLVKMEDAQFWDVMRVHVKGHFGMMRHTVAHWRDRAKAAGGSVYGRLISTASDAFLMGNLGQPNYAAAKAAVTYLTMSASREVQRYGATANVILPRARTRMTNTGPWAGIFAKPEQGFDTFAPEHIGPLVAWLASPLAAHVSGQVIQAWGKHVRVYERPRPALDHENDAEWTVEGLEKVLGPFFAGKKPVEDGFLLPMA